MKPTFRDLIAENKRKSVLLVIVFCLFATVTVPALGLGIFAFFDPRSVARLQWREVFVLGGLAGGATLIFALFGYYLGGMFIQTAAGARPIRHRDDPELFNVVEEMAIAAGVPMPQVCLIDDRALNAFATGRDPQHALVAVTTGLRRKLSRDELQGVIAHEISHIRNYDIRLMLLMAVLVGTIVVLSDVFWQLMRYSWNRGGSSDSNSGGGDSRSREGGLVGLLILLAVPVVAILLSLLAPSLAHLLQFAVSRQREYLADATAVELTRYPQGLANALRKLDADTAVLKSANRGIAHLFIANPIEKFQAKAHSAFASHPPLKERIARLEALAREVK